MVERPVRRGGLSAPGEDASAHGGTRQSVRARPNNVHLDSKQTVGTPHDEGVLVRLSLGTRSQGTTSPRVNGPANRTPSHGFSILKNERWGRTRNSNRGA